LNRCTCSACRNSRLQPLKRHPVIGYRHASDAECSAPAGAASVPALAIDYRSVIVPAVAILYDSPSQSGKKLYLIKAQTPVEVVVKLDGWSKVRDAEGTLGLDGNAQPWRTSYSGRDCSQRLRFARLSKPDAPLVVAELDKWVALELCRAGFARLG
jgi:hypothetical protein